jgi:hypothetical protein
MTRMCDALLWGRIAPGMTESNRHAPFARSLDARGRGIVHLVDEVVIDWSNRQHPQIGATWRCAQLGHSARVELLSDAADESLCRTCALILEAEALGAQPGTLAVYYAERDGFIKVGISRNVGRRLAALKARLLAVEAGNYMSESNRHEQFAHLRVDGEWFSPGPDLLAHIETLAVPA